MKRPGFRSVAALTALSVAAFAYVTTESLPIGLLPLLAAGFRESPSAIGYLVSAYGAVVVVASIPLTIATRKMPRPLLLPGLLAVFVAATLFSAVAPSYGALLAARIVTALSQALFWSIVVPAAAGLVDANARGRAIAIVFAGSSLAALAGIPIGTWIGQQGGWRLAFVTLAGVGAASSVALAMLLPRLPGEGRITAMAPHPDSIRYALLVVVTIVATTGAFSALTYVVPFLTATRTFPPSSIGVLLLVRGAAGLAGVFAGGRFVDRDPFLATAAPILMQGIALVGLALLGDVALLSIACIALSGFAFAALTTALGSRVLDVAPGNIDMAASGLSTGVNVGITAGALIGGLLLPAFGVRAAVLAGGLLSSAGLLLALTEPFLVRRPRRRRFLSLPDKPFAHSLERPA